MSSGRMTTWIDKKPVLGLCHEDRWILTLCILVFTLPLLLLALHRLNLATLCILERQGAPLGNISSVLMKVFWHLIELCSVHKYILPCWGGEGCHILAVWLCSVTDEEGLDCSEDTVSFEMKLIVNG